MIDETVVLSRYYVVKDKNALKTFPAISFAGCNTRLGISSVVIVTIKGDVMHV